MSAESLAVVAYYRETTTVEVDDPSEGGTSRLEAVQTGFSFGLLKGTELVLPFSTTRLGLDGVLARGLTLGTSLGYSSVGGHIETTQTAEGFASEAEEDEVADVSLMVFVPRVGYLFAPNQYVSVWVRGGFGYARMSVDDPDSIDDLDREMLNFVLDPMLISSPIEHFGIILGPQLNVGLSGSLRTPSSAASGIETTLTHSSFGVTVGLAFLL